jgi:hypothetical protein
MPEKETVQLLALAYFLCKLVLIPSNNNIKNFDLSKTITESSNFVARKIKFPASKIFKLALAYLINLSVLKLLYKLESPVTITSFLILSIQNSFDSFGWGTWKIKALTQGAFVLHKKCKMFKHKTLYTKQIYDIW